MSERKDNKNKLNPSGLSKSEKQLAHIWVTKHLGKSGACEHCGSTDKKTEWSNKDHLYKKEVSHWQRLCRSCHRRYDHKTFRYLRERFLRCAKRNGAKNGKLRCKFTPHQAKKIRERYRSGEKQVNLAKEFSVDQSTISLLVNHRTYAKNEQESPRRSPSKTTTMR